MKRKSNKNLALVLFIFISASLGISAISSMNELHRERQNNGNILRENEDLKTNMYFLEEENSELNSIIKTYDEKISELEDKIKSLEEELSKSNSGIKEVKAETNESSKSEFLYSASKFKTLGVVNWNGYRWTWYSQRVLPGGGLHIPGRHVDENGYVCDECGYICLASGSLAKGTVVSTPLGKDGKIYDFCETAGTIDVYTDF